MDDKSTDTTIEVVRNYMKEFGDKHNIRMLTLRCNLGKGGAVKQGVRRARGRSILMVVLMLMEFMRWFNYDIQVFTMGCVYGLFHFGLFCVFQVDADGATDINDLGKLHAELSTVKIKNKVVKDEVGLVVGSRYGKLHMQYEYNS